LEGFGKGASVFAIALLGGLLPGDPEGRGRRAQGTDIILHGGPAGEFNRGLVYQAL